MAGRILLTALAGFALLAASSYQGEIAEWRHQREDALKRDGGWLTVAGLFWLHDGPNGFGKDPSNDIVLPDGPAHAGVFELHEGKVTVKTDAAARELWPDSLDVAKAGRLSLFAIKRSDKYGIRLKDPDSEYRRGFHGIEYYPAKEEYRVTAKFVTVPTKIPILNILGQTEPMESPGYAAFRLNGQETYGAGRFLYSDLPHDGTVVLDFNKAYNPPCAFTPYATCPLPPSENRLAIKVEAGEKKYGQH